MNSLDQHSDFNLNIATDVSYPIIDVHTTGMIARCIKLSESFGDWESVFNAISTKYKTVSSAAVFEPRGGSGSFGAFLFPSIDPSCDYSIIFFERRQLLKMCGHATVCSVIAAQMYSLISLQDGLNEVRVSTAIGVIVLRVQFSSKQKKVLSVSLQNVPSFVHTSGLSFDYNGVTLPIDVGYGGNFFALVDVTDQISVKKNNAIVFAELGPKIRDYVNKTVDVKHPDDDQIRGVPLILFYDTKTFSNCVIFGNSSIDRSPCGSGTSALSSLLHKRGLISTEPYTITSIIGSQFKCKVSETTVAGKPAIIPTLSATPYLLGYGQLVLQDDDPFQVLALEEPGF
ncbi:hypothetical protein GEMRC1_006534 [Eukaryota sp. GEM-RC1]